jgi:hypothetical protein
MEMILNKSQAEAVYGAMCALNNVNARAHVTFEDGPNIVAMQRHDGAVVVDCRGDTELYDSQSAFAAAYVIA